MGRLRSKKVVLACIVILLSGFITNSDISTETYEINALIAPSDSINSSCLIEEQKEMHQSMLIGIEANREKAAVFTKVFEIPILMYHSIAYEAKNELRIPKEKFEEQMRFLKENGYTSISMKEAYEIINDEKLSPEKPVVISFDDGYTDNYSNAYPILEKYGLKGTIFIITDMVDKNGQYLTSSEIREMHRKGIDFQSHTVHHEELNGMNYERQVKTMAHSKEFLESCLNSRVIALSYPVGKYNSNSIKAAKDTGYLMAVTTKYGFAKKKDGMFTLTRVRINASDNLNSFSAKIRTTNNKRGAKL